MRMKHFLLLCTTAAAFVATSAQAAIWSDTYLGYRYGTKFAEPFKGNNITKNIFNLNHVSGYKYGTNFFNVDMLMSNNKDPANASTSSVGAQEAYVVYRNTLDLGKITGKSYKFGPVSDLGVTLGFDWNTKTDAGYNSKKRMLVLGPTLMFDVPGFLNVSLLELWESNAPCSTSATGADSCVARYHYKVHPMLSAAWGIPVGKYWSFEGYAQLIASKGKDEYGNQTKTETHVDMEMMLDVGAVTGGPKKTFKVGLEYEYWKNKFGNNASGDPGAFAKTPMIRAEYHF